MMFGLRESFDYLECSNCGCLQIKEIPDDMYKYYSNENYYSFNRSNFNFLLRKIINKRNKYCLFRDTFFGKLINIKYPNSLYSVLGDIGLDKEARILDVGCGSGGLLYDLKEIGFKKLTGIDLFLTKEVNETYFKILRESIHQVPGEKKYDIIIFSHSFEHMADPLEILSKVRSILSEKGKVIVSIPVKTDFIWNLYGINWVQIDAPRHFFIYTINSFKILADNVGLKIDDIIFDSTEFQFWGSEQYKHDIPLESKFSYKNDPKNSIFTKKDIERFKDQAKELNKKNQGDQAIFILEK